jgi:hypothetical protein
VPAKQLNLPHSIPNDLNTVLMKNQEGERKQRKMETAQGTSLLEKFQGLQRKNHILKQESKLLLMFDL